MVERLHGRALELSYDGGTRALAGVEFSLKRGEFVCVLGPNGSGKTTLLRILSGNLTSSAGSLELDGKPLHTLRARDRARAIASVPQVLESLPDADVADFVLGGRYPYLGLWGSARASDYAAVRRALAEADAAAWTDRRLGELSGGQCQRVLVARALAQEAPLLLFDEPTAALDPEHQVQLFRLFTRLACSGADSPARGVLVATHELALAGRFADRIILLDRGRIVASGSSDEVLRREVLEPVYGPHLYYGEGPYTAQGATGGGHAATRPLIVPWPKTPQTGRGNRNPRDA